MNAAIKPEVLDDRRYYFQAKAGNLVLVTESPTLILQTFDDLPELLKYVEHLKTKEQNETKK